MPDNPYVVKPLLGAFRVLETLAEGLGPLSLPDLAASARLSKTTAFRYLRTLASLGYAEQLADGRYSLGPSVNLLGGENARENALHAVAEPYLLKLHGLYGETVNLGVPKGRRIHYLAILMGKTPQIMQAEVGDSDCFHCTALGKALLAYLPADSIANHLKSSLPRLTPHTIQTRRQLDQELAKVRRFGYAIDREENEIGCVCYAAPIFDQPRRPVAAVSISVPQVRLTAALDVALAEAVVTTANAITRHALAAQVRSKELTMIRSKPRQRVGSQTVTRRGTIARSQELSTDGFETVIATVRFSRGLFGKPANHAIIKKSLATFRCGTSAAARSSPYPAE